MEKVGVISGIGNKIIPEIDAVVNEFIVNKNAIITGLSLVRMSIRTFCLTKGMCIFDGYRGVLDSDIDNIQGSYIYAKFVLNFDENTEDEFSIVVSDIEIETKGFVNGAGTYYMLLYTDWQQIQSVATPMVNKIPYPYIAEFSDKASYLTTITYPNGVTNVPIISEAATTPTAEVNAHTNESTRYRIANVEYVHNQIQYELAEAEVVVPVYELEGNNVDEVGQLHLFRKGNIVWGKSSRIKNTARTAANISFKLPEGFIPNQDIQILFNSRVSLPSITEPTGRHRLLSYNIQRGDSAYSSTTLLVEGFCETLASYPIGYSAIRE